jgi:hypothetical protein
MTCMGGDFLWLRFLMGVIPSVPQMPVPQMPRPANAPRLGRPIARRAPGRKAAATPEGEQLKLL